MVSRRDVLRLASFLLPATVLGRRPAEAQGEEIRIGALTPLTGAGSPYGPGMQKAIALAVEEVNAAGGPLGRKLRLFTEDGQTEPEAAVRAAKKLIEVNRVAAILGTWSSGVTAAVAPLSLRAGIVHMHTSGGPEFSQMHGNAQLWRYEASNVLYGEVFAKVALSRGFKRAATMAFNNPSGKGNTGEFRKVFEKAGGQVVEALVYNPNQPTYRAELEKVLAVKPEVIVTGSYQPDTTIILKEWFQTGQKVQWISPGWAITPKLIEALGNEVVQGVLVVQSIAASDSVTFKRISDEYRKRAGQELVANPYAAMTYDMVNVLALAVEAARSAEPAQFGQKIRTVAGPPGTAVSSFADGVAELRRGGEINYEGASNRLDFDENGDSRPNFGVYEVRAGQRVQIDTVRS